jgi:tetratricopeptide (TPR) repeat protein
MQPRAAAWNRRNQGGGILTALLGDGRRLFANHFFTKADIAFHGGYYPSIFDSAARPKDRSHMKQKDDEHGGHGEPEQSAGEEPEHAGSCNHKSDDQATEHEKEMAFLGKPRDWVEAFGRRFIITEHKHLEGETRREMLPWLKIAAELNPDLPETYTVAAYWLRDLKRTKEAEAFLREGLRNIPDSWELYFDLGRLYKEDHNDTKQARNLWELALAKWLAAEKAGRKPDLLLLDQIAVHLARAEEAEGNLAKAISLLKMAQKGSPSPDTLDAQIRDLEKRASEPPQ